MACRLVEKETRINTRKKMYGDAYKKMVKLSIWKVVASIGQFVKYFSSEEATVKQNRQNSGKKNNTTLGKTCFY